MKNDLNGGFRKKSQKKTEPKPPQKTPQEIQQENIDIIKKHLSYFKSILETKIRNKLDQNKKDSYNRNINEISKLIDTDLDNFNDKKNEIIDGLNSILNDVEIMNNHETVPEIKNKIINLIKKTIEAAGKLN